MFGDKRLLVCRPCGNGARARPTAAIGLYIHDFHGLFHGVMTRHARRESLSCAVPALRQTLRPGAEH